MTEIVLAGGSAPELMAVSGHRDMRVAQEYVEEAFSRPELADAALSKVRTKRDGAYTNKIYPAHKQPKKPA